MAKRRQIDERDVDQILASLTDTQIANVFGMTEIEVSELRRARQAKGSSSHENKEKPSNK